jgi:uncharacterized protein YbaP (TraB family)
VILKQRIRALCLGLALASTGGAWAQSTVKATDKAADKAACPPQASQPTPEQMQAAAAKAKDRGMLWRISKDGRTSYLFGTIHLGKLDWAFHGQQVRSALMAADTVALEIDVTDRAIVSRLKPPPGAAVPVLPEALRKRLDQQITLACIPKEAIAAQHPVMQAIALSGLDARWVGYDLAYAQEFFLAGFAQATKKPVISLETPELQMKALLPTTEKDALDAVERTLQDLEEGKARRIVGRMAVAWEAGNLEELATYEQWCDCIRDDADRAFYKRINDGRNPHLADRIASVHAEGKRVFAAVGALHMTGEKALPKLLAERGFTVERVNYQ